MRKSIISLLVGLFMLPILEGCWVGNQPDAERILATVVQTVPVEVTRLVEVEKTVEVTRQVVITQLVTSLATSTPSIMELATASQTPAALLTLETPTPATPTPTFPQEKVKGFSILLVVNETDDDLVVELSGTVERSLLFRGPSQALERVKEGDYAYIVWRQSQVLFQGTFKITNPDKFELHIRKDKVVFLVP